MKTAEELFSLFLETKKKYNLRYVDTHVHPFDVLGVHTVSKDGQTKPLPLPSLLEYLEYNTFSLKVIEWIFKFSPAIIRQSIIRNFDGAGELRLLQELEEAGIDQAVLVPVAPFSDISAISALYQASQFLKVGTVNIAKLSQEEIKIQLLKEIGEFGIKGIKMHPNIQLFYPQPSKNPPHIAERLRTIYRFAKENNLYLLFHGGISHLLHTATRKVEHAVLENFCDQDGKSEIFEYGAPVIIAHAGHYNMPRINEKLLRRIAERYSNVFFDTSGVSPYVLKQAIEAVGSTRFVFGSDANYFRIKYNVHIVLKAIAMADTGEPLEEKIANIFSYTFQKIILKH